MRSLFLLSGLILACAGATVEPSPPTNANIALRSSAPRPCAAQGGPAEQRERREQGERNEQGEPTAELKVSLRPVPRDDGGVVAVVLDVTGPAKELRSWRVPELAGALDVRVTLLPPACPAPVATESAAVTQQLHGAAGELLAVALPAGASTVALRLEYSVPPQKLAAPLWRLEPNWFLAYGRRLLLLPQERSWAAQVQVEIDASSYGEVARGVSSLGLVPQQPAPPRSLRVTLPALQHSLFAAGWMSSALFEATEGHDEAAWFGATLFDVRLLAAEVASFRTAVREVFRDAAGRPLTLIVMADLEQGFEARRAPMSVLLRVGSGERLTAGLRLEVLQQVMKEWIGGQLSVQDEQGAEPLWFGEGLSRYLARELALEFGLISPEEHAADVNSLMAMQAILTRHECARVAQKEGAEAEAEVAAAPSCARVLEAARGILHATALDAALRAQRSSLIELLSGLFRDRSGPLSLSEWRAALESAGQPAAKKNGVSPALRVHEAFLASGTQPLLLPSNAFGPCFVREPTRYVESLLGFVQERPAAAAAPLRVTAVDPASPAEAAGLRPDTLLQRIEHIPYDPERPIRLVLQDGLILQYRGAQARVPGLAWRRVPGVKDARCRLSGRGNASAR